MRLVHNIGNDPVHDKSDSASPRGLTATRTTYSAGNKRKRIETMDMGDMSREELMERVRERDIQLMQKDKEILEKDKELLQKKIELLQNELREERLRSGKLEQKLRTMQERTEGNED